MSSHETPFSTDTPGPSPLPLHSSPWRPPQHSDAVPVMGISGLDQLHYSQTSRSTLDFDRGQTQRLLAQPSNQALTAALYANDKDSEQLSAEDRRSPSLDDESEKAHAAWHSRFSVRQLTLSRNDSEPFSAGRRLGGGGIGIVHETSLDGIPLALKRTYARRLTEFQLNEIKILGRMSEERHRHVVELVGSYIHQQRGVYELGLLIWPVAHCDLAAFLHELDTLEEWCSRQRPYAGVGSSSDDISSTFETLSNLLGLQPSPVSASFALRVLLAAKYRLLRSYGCITKAVAYLHSQGIRHKDLKPSQILISPNGLWLTDFGWSNDMSEFSQSATSGGDNITTKYQSPERANKQPCGRAEDVFALGCCFLEMSSYATDEITIGHQLDRPWLQKGWSFQANLTDVYQYLAARLETSSYHIHTRAFDQLLMLMLASEPQERPTIEEILQKLFDPPFGALVGLRYFSAYFDSCCQRQDPTTLPDLRSPEQIAWPIPSTEIREPNTSFAGSTSWGGVSVGSWIREDIMMSGTLQEPLESPSFHSSSYLPKIKATFMKDITCCGLTFTSLHELTEHFKKIHANAPASGNLSTRRSDAINIPQNSIAHKTSRTTPHVLGSIHDQATVTLPMVQNYNTAQYPMAQQIPQSISYRSQDQDHPFRTAQYPTAQQIPQTISYRSQDQDHPFQMDATRWP